MRRGQSRDGERESETSSAWSAEPGKRSLTSAIQRRAASVGERPASSPPSESAPAADRLPAAVQSTMGDAFDFDFSGVRVHEGPQASALGASAYTEGANVHFAPGQYDPASAPGKELIGHELAHVVQQREGRVAATTQFKGVAGNDDAGLEREADEWGARAARGESVGRSGGAGGAIRGGGPVQRKLTVTGEHHGTFDGDGDVARFKELVAAVDGKLRDEKFKSAWTVSRLRKYVDAITGADATVDWSEIAAEATKAVSLALALGGKGLPLFDKPEEVTFGDEEATGAKGYVGKMVKGLEEVLTQTKQVKVTIGMVESAGLEDTSGLARIEPHGASSSEERRPGLTILNYATVYFDAKTGTLVVCEVRGRALCDQFALALQAYGKHTGAELAVDKVEPDKSERPLKGNYARLTEFFREEDPFRKAQTLTFGYASAFKKNEAFVQVAEKHAGGWVGTLYQVGEDRFVAVLDSDLKSSYHGEILAKNVKQLLDSPFRGAITTILAGGSAGSLLPSKDNESGPHLPPATIYTPDSILGPDGKLVPNALAGLGQSNIKGSIHSSVVSALVETPQLLQNLVDLGIQTIDMEFGYVAAVVNKANAKEQAKDQDERRPPVSFGIACLITDYPKTSGGTDLHSKDDKAKDQAKKSFTETVLQSALR